MTIPYSKEVAERLFPLVLLEDRQEYEETEKLRARAEELFTDKPRTPRDRTKMSAIERFHHKLKFTTVTIPYGKRGLTATLNLQMGLSWTVNEAKKLPDDIVVKCAQSLGATGYSAERCRGVLGAYLQVKWYEAKDATTDSAYAQAKVTLQNCLQNARNLHIESPNAPKEKKPRVSRFGMRTYCRQLVQEGEHCVELLVEKVNLRFPEQKAKFTIRNARQALRFAGILPWTEKKGKPRKGAASVCKFDASMN